MGEISTYADYNLRCWFVVFQVATPCRQHAKDISLSRTSRLNFSGTSVEGRLGRADIAGKELVEQPMKYISDKAFP